MAAQGKRFRKGANALQSEVLDFTEMNETAAATALTLWKTPECPFAIEYSPRVFDDIRLAVVDAFCSLPRGGVEIGGVLLGKWEPGLLRITGYAALDCEHANGPGFMLSANDEDRLRELLAQGPREYSGLVPVGWYHSHTRSDIFLSDVDLAIHERFFPESWQVAAVFRPRMMQPVRVGFFFREASGQIQSTAPYQDFPLEAQPMLPAPAGPAADMPQAEGGPRTLRMQRNPAIGIPGEVASTVTVEPPLHTDPLVATMPVATTPVATPPVATPPTIMPAPRIAPAPPAPRAAEAAPQPDVPAEPPPPGFLTAEPTPGWRWLNPLLGLCALAAFGGAGYVTHDAWLPKVMAAVRPSPVIPGAPPTLRLKTIDHEGQLQINWDRNLPAVRAAVDARLEITDGSSLPQTIALDQAHLENGSFSYGRQSARVDVKLILNQPDGRQIRDVTAYVGPLPVHQSAEEDSALRTQREAMAAQADKLKSDLDRQAARTRKLERDLKSVREELEQQQKRRMANQVPPSR